ncbi:MAG: protease modulator HflC [Gammaproteobacteria bacterium]|nr:MAG: protease modulator HflC [Gammaproteobacteria bacterium]
MAKSRLFMVLGVIGLLVLVTSFFIVDERQVAIKFQLGKIIESEYEPGLHFMKPLFINNVSKFDKRILTLDTRPERFLTGEKKNVSVDFFVKWRIKDPATYYTAFAGDERQAALRLLQIIKNGLQLEFENRTIRQVVSGERAEMMDSLTRGANEQVKQFGIGIIDVRIKQIELPDDVRDAVYQRMRAERARVAAEHRAQGEENAKGIRAVAERERTVILAEAQRDADTIRGEGDARATEIYADAYGRDEEFYAFYRSMSAYRDALNSKQDVMVLQPDSEFFRYFNTDASN